MYGTIGCEWHDDDGCALGCPNKYHVENQNLSLGMTVAGLIHGERCVANIGPVI